MLLSFGLEVAEDGEAVLGLYLLNEVVAVGSSLIHDDELRAA